MDPQKISSELKVTIQRGLLNPDQILDLLKELDSGSRTSLENYKAYFIKCGINIDKIDLRHGSSLTFEQGNASGIYLFLGAGIVELGTGQKYEVAASDLIWIRGTDLSFSGNIQTYVAKFSELRLRVKPEVINIKGTKNNRRDTLYIGRPIYMGGWQLPGSKWANPFKAKDYTSEECMRLYRNHVLNSPELMTSLPELEGHKLGCWCKPKSCHGDVLVELFETYVK